MELWASNDLAAVAPFLGDASVAERELRTALRLDPEDAFTIAALALLGDDLGNDGKLVRSAIALASTLPACLTRGSSRP